MAGLVSLAIVVYVFGSAIAFLGGCFAESFGEPRWRARIARPFASAAWLGRRFYRTIGRWLFEPPKDGQS